MANDISITEAKTAYDAALIAAAMARGNEAEAIEIARIANQRAAEAGQAAAQAQAELMNATIAYANAGGDLSELVSLPV